MDEIFSSSILPHSSIAISRNAEELREPSFKMAAYENLVAAEAAPRAVFNEKAEARSEPFSPLFLRGKSPHLHPA
jgi:hypothetical protein